VNPSKDLQLCCTSPVSPGYVEIRREAGTETERKRRAKKDAEDFFLVVEGVLLPAEGGLV